MDPLLDALLAPFLDPLSRTWWPALLASGAIALGWWAWRRPRWTLAGARRVLTHPSTALDVQLLLGRQLLGLLPLGVGAGGAWLLASHGVRLLDRHLGRPDLQAPAWLATLATTLALFLAWDASRFLLHLAMHRLPVLWAFHQVHHSAEVLTPLTFHRIHPVESLLYQLRGALVTGLVTALCFWLFRVPATGLELAGVPAIGLVLNVVSGNLRHSHAWIPFPAAVERWLLSPAQHQLHHAADPALAGSNLGTWLALWDRLFGTLVPSQAPPARFGLPAAMRNHDHDLLSAWLGPLRQVAAPIRQAFGHLRRWLAPAALLMAALPAQAQEPPAEDEEAPEEEEESPPPTEEAGLEVIVYAPDGNPRVAGSAHVVSEEVLERFEYDNIEQVLSQVPGVTTRSEDGFGLRPNIGIRGANAERSAKITLLEDGVLLAPAPYAAPAAYYFPMTGRVVGVEVFKGPAATRHGPHTVGGAVNLRTRPIPDGPAGEVDVAAGRFWTARAHAWGGTSGEHLGLLAEVSHLRSAGFKHLPGGEPTGFDHTEGMLKGGWRPGWGQELELKLGATDETSHEDYLGLTATDFAADPTQRYLASSPGLMRYQRSQAELAWTAKAAGGLQVRTVAYHHYLTRRWFKLNGFADGTDLHDLLQADPTGGTAALYLAILRGEEDTTTAEQALVMGTNDRRYHAFGLQSLARWDRQGDRVGSTLELGLRLHGDVVDRLHDEAAWQVQDGALVDPGVEPTVTTDSTETAQALAAHVHEELRLGMLHLLPGARVEVIRGTSTDHLRAEGEPQVDPVTRAVLLPGGAVLLRPLDALDLFAGAHRGFSPVAPGEDAQVQPELAWSYEAGTRVSRPGAHAEVVGFLVDYINLTGDCTLSGGCSNDDLGRSFSGGKVWVWGLEASAAIEAPLPAGLRLPLEASYGLTRSRFRTAFVSDFPEFGDVDVGDSLPYSPTHQAGARAALVHDRFDLGLGAAWRSGMLDEAGTFPVTETDVPALLLLDAAASVQVHKGWSLYATGTNLAGEQAIVSWRPYGARPTAPLQVMAGVEWKAGG